MNLPDARRTCGQQDTQKKIAKQRQGQKPLRKACRTIIRLFERREMDAEWGFTLTVGISRTYSRPFGGARLGFVWSRARERQRAAFVA